VTPVLNPDAREARARLEAHRRRAASGGDLDQLTREVMAEMNAAEGDHSEIDAMIDGMPRMTGAQVERLRRLFGMD
jgi:hypothetical protein